VQSSFFCCTASARPQNLSEEPLLPLGQLGQDDPPLKGRRKPLVELYDVEWDKKDFKELSRALKQMIRKHAVYALKGPGGRLPDYAKVILLDH
jgi:hypothetical protein